MENKYRALIVDDDKFLLGMYKKKFESEHIATDVAGGSLEALDKLRDGAKPDILILDIIMPDMDGVELLETIRKENLVPDAVVIMLTNESEKEIIEKTKSLKVNGYLVKATGVPSEIVVDVLKIADAFYKNTSKDNNVN